MQAKQAYDMLVRLVSIWVVIVWVVEFLDKNKGLVDFVVFEHSLDVAVFHWQFLNIHFFELCQFEYYGILKKLEIVELNSILLVTEPDFSFNK